LRVEVCSVQLRCVTWQLVLPILNNC
jgi:hypothetical protein